MKIDRIECLRGGQMFPVKLGNGDMLDSVIRIYNGSTLVYQADYANTDPSLAWAGKGGIMAECECRWICDRRRDNGKKVLFLYTAGADRDRQIVKAADLSQEERTFASLIPNPAHGGLWIMTNLLVHGIGVNTDGSQGCITMKDFGKFIDYFELGDKGAFSLVRSSTWQPPNNYRIPGGHP